MGIYKYACLLVLIASLCACGSVPVVQDVTQGQAVEVVAVLGARGIRAEAVREPGGRGLYRVEVKRSMYVQTMSFLHSQGLPSEERVSFSDLVAQRGFLPNSREVEALRLDRAMAAEIEETLQNFPGVISARVLVRLHASRIGRPGLESYPAGVSVMLVEKPDLKIDQNKVRNLVQRAVPAVSPEGILISAQPPAKNDVAGGTEGVFYGSNGQIMRVPLTPFLWIWRVPEDEYEGMALAFIGGVVVIFVLGAVVGFWMAYYRQARRHLEFNPPDAGSFMKRPSNVKSEKPQKE